MQGSCTSGTPQPKTMRAAATSCPRLNSRLSVQWYALPPSHTMTIRSRMSGLSKMAEATFVIAPIAIT